MRRSIPAAVQALRLTDGWDVPFAAAGVTRADGDVDVHGDRSKHVPWASVTKLLTGLATLVAVEEGTVDLDEPAGPPGSTLRHLLAHASGLPTGATPARRRVYSNEAFDVVGELVASRAGMPFEEYFAEAVAEPLDLRGSLQGSPASAYVGPLDDLLALGRELLAPTLVAQETLDEATTVQFPGLAGVVPSWGRHDPNDWGLAFELHDRKSPHWMSARSSPQTFGHYGRSGTFIWVDPELRVACCVLTNRDFDDWATEAWPAFNDAVVAELRP
jgi:CubicO group peptidase (beta-lactamase class C family)